MRPIRLLTLKSLELNTRVFVRHVRTEDNEIADSLSRDQMQRFKRLTEKLQVNNSPDQIPEDLWPIDKIWKIDD